MILGCRPQCPVNLVFDKFRRLLSTTELVVVTRIVERSPVMKKKFIVRLSVEELASCNRLSPKARWPRGLTDARILLKADCSLLGPAWSDQQISEAVDLGVIAVHRFCRSFVESIVLSFVVLCRVVPECSLANRRPI